MSLWQVTDLAADCWYGLAVLREPTEDQPPIDGAAEGCAAAAPRDRAADAAERLTAVLRVVVAVASAAIYCADPSEDPARRPAAYAVLAAFVLHASAMLVLTRRGARRPSRAAAPWVDVAFVTTLVAASEGTSSIFFPLYLFAVLCAAFEGGARAGLRIVATAVLSFSIVGGLTAPRGPAFELDRALIRPLYLGVLGYLISFWGEHERRSRRKLQLLRATTALSNPRFGVERSVASTLEAVRAFFGADACRVVVVAPRGDGWTQVAARSHESDREGRVGVPAELARALVPERPAALVHRQARGARLRRVPELDVLATADGTWGRGDASEGERIAELLDAVSFASVPFDCGPGAAGRLYVTSRRASAFDRADAEFLLHVQEQVAPVLETIGVVDRLASDAAGDERRRIALDLHDSIIQPYVGLRLGMASLRDAVAAGRVEEARSGLERLLAIADEEIRTLRGFTRALSDASRGVRGPMLASAVERFCGRFAAATGIRVDLHVAGDPALNDRLSAEVFQLVAEALSNVRRHTSATSADVRIDVADGALRIAVENDGVPGEGRPFAPRSLSARATALGGRTVVAAGRGRTAVRIQIPL
jgi:signal transduction histidine kinase